jgi:hypothetical protein
MDMLYYRSLPPSLRKKMDLSYQQSRQPAPALEEELWDDDIIIAVEPESEEAEPQEHGAWSKWYPGHNPQYLYRARKLSNGIKPF